MKKTILSILLAILCLTGKSFGQVGITADEAYLLDTLRTHSYSAGLSFLFFISDSEMKDYTNLRLHNSLHFNYMFEKTDTEMGFRQFIERKDNGDWISNQQLFLYGGFFKYRTINPDIAVQRKVFPEAVAIYQDNTDRGLRRRFQLWAMIHPWGLYKPKFSLNFGVGILHDWSSWEVNDKKEIDAVSPELREKILFINSRIKLRKNMYQDHNEWRPVVYVTFDYHINEVITAKFSAAYQQSLVSPYSKEIKAAYPDLKKVHPYIQGHLDVSVKLYKGLALNATLNMDYENNNLSLYKSSWSYNMLAGFSWTFSNQKRRIPLKQ